MYILFRCRCGRHLYASQGAKTRTCPCGRRTQLDKARVLGRAENALAAGELVRRMQAGEGRMTGFHPAGGRD